MSSRQSNKADKPVGLRERKKQKIRWAIQEHALRLFAQQGYEATTIDQIAAAAEISPSTFFRYFKTKEDLVIEDEYDPRIVEAIEQAPAGLTTIQTMRYVLQLVFAGFSQAEEEKTVERGRLIFSVPSLRSRSLEIVNESVNVMVAALRQRPGQRLDDFTLRVISGALVGAWLAVMDEWMLEEGQHGHFIDMIDRALDILEHLGAEG